MTQSTISRKTYVLTWAALMLLAAGTTLVGTINLGAMSMAFAILFATAKAALIVYIFMQAKTESKVVLVVIAAGIIWFLILLTNTLGDYVTRGWLPFPGK